MKNFEKATVKAASRGTFWAKICAAAAFVLSLALLIPLAACGDNTPSGNIDYTVSVHSIGGIALQDVEVEFYSGEKRVEHERTNSEGVAVLNVPADGYDVRLINVPKGYIYEDTYQITAANPALDLKLSSSVILEDMPRNNTYAVGDIMYDITVQNTENETLQLSELLKTYKAVLLNFWYTNCSWCVKEFPIISEVYEEYKDKIAILALNTYTSEYDTFDDVVAFKDEYEIPFDMAKADPSLFVAFGGQGYPTSVMVDRFGVVSDITSGAILEKSSWQFLFETYTSDSYDPSADNEEDLRPNVSMPASSEIEAAINADGYTATYYPEENPNTWPWIIAEDGTSIKSSNREKRGTNAFIYSNVQIAADDVLAFDYKVSSEENSDFLHVFIDDMVMFSFSGNSGDWKTCYAYVPLKAGTHRLALAYVKDSSGSEGDDTAYVRNVRFCKQSDIQECTYIKRPASVDMKSDNTGYETYVTPVFNETDKYYHVGTENGPLLLADLMHGNTHWSNYRVYDYITDENCTLSDDDKQAFVTYFAHAVNSSVGYAPVDAKLKELLDTLTKYAAENDEQRTWPWYENEWLEVCLYYQHYGEGGEMDNPLRGVAANVPFDSYDVTHDGGTDQNPYLNEAVIDRLTSPRGRYFRYVATQSGAYEIKSYGENETIVWIYTAGGKLIIENDDPLVFDGPDTEQHNFLTYAYFEEGKSYLINVAYNNPTATGTFEFSVKRLGDRCEYLKECATNAYVPILDDKGEMTGELELAEAIKEELHTDGFYHKVNADGSLGNVIYVDFTHTTFFTPNHTLSMLIDMKKDGVGYFDFSQEIDPTTQEPYGATYDFTEKMREYLETADKDGFVAANAELVRILQMFTAREDDRNRNPESEIEFEEVPNAWLAMSYYYEIVDASTAVND